MNGFALLWGKILYSSLWMKESPETRLVWITMLALKDSEGRIQMSVLGLHDIAKVSLEDTKKALEIFLAPDPDDTSKVEEGRRIREIPGGWQVVNHDLYRFSTEAKREFWRKTKAEQRERDSRRKKAVRTAKSITADNNARSRRYDKADKNGNVEACDRIAAEGLPGEPEP